MIVLWSTSSLSTNLSSSSWITRSPSVKWVSLLPELPLLLRARVPSSPTSSLHGASIYTGKLEEKAPYLILEDVFAYLTVPGCRQVFKFLEERSTELKLVSSSSLPFVVLRLFFHISAHKVRLLIFTCCFPFLYSPYPPLSKRQPVSPSSEPATSSSLDSPNLRTPSSVVESSPSWPPLSV